MSTEQLDRVMSPEALRQEFLSAERAKWLTVEEAAFVLSTSRDVIFRMIDNKSLPTRKDGRVIRIHLDDLRPRATEVPA